MPSGITTGSPFDYFGREKRLKAGRPVWLPMAPDIGANAGASIGSGTNLLKSLVDTLSTSPAAAGEQPMPMDPQQLLQQLMAGGEGMGPAKPPYKPGPNPGLSDEMPIPPSADQELMAKYPAPASGPSDEEMLDTVHNAMGERSADGPPPGSGMKWENLEEDQAALQEQPTDANIAAFVEYWGEENLPEGMGPVEGAPSYATEETPSE
jgi:hypothetical protein